MRQEEYETRFYEKHAGRARVVNTPNDSTKTPDREKPVVDSRDAMDRKKDEIWGKMVIPSWRERRDDDVWAKNEERKKILPHKMPKFLQKYNWFNSYDDAVEAWANFNRPFSKELERCALIYQFTVENGNQYYTHGKTKIGMNAIPELGVRDNVALALASLYLGEGLPHTKRVGFVHTHPDIPGNERFSDEDRMLKKLPGIDSISVAPYGKDIIKTE